MKENVKQNVKENEKQDEKKTGLKAFLTQDRGGTNFKKIYEKVPEHFYEYAGFVIVLLMIGLLLVEEIYRVFFDSPKLELYIKFFYLVGAFGEIFSVFYLGSFIFGKKKETEKYSFKKLLKTHIWDLALGLMLFWSVLSTFQADYLDLALKGTTYRFDGLYTYLVYASMYICAKAVKSPKLRMWILRANGIMLTLLSLMSIPQTNFELMLKWGKVGDNLFRYGIYSSIFYNTNHFGYFLTIGILAIAGLVILEKKWYEKGIWAILLGFNVWALIINNTFGSYLGVMFGLIFLSIIILVQDKERFRSVLAVLTVFIAVSVAMDAKTHTLSENFGVTIKESQEFTTNDSAGSGRIELWKQAIKYIKERPVFGFGPDGLAYRYYDDGFVNERPHNEYLQHAAFLGIPGATFYLIALISLFIYCIRRVRKLSPIMLVAGGTVFAYCVSAFFGNTMYYTTPYYFIILGMLSACHLDFKETESK